MTWIALKMLRVVQLLYAIDPRHKQVRDKKILVGQLVDVFIDTGPWGGAGVKPQEKKKSEEWAIDSRASAC